MRLFIAIQFEDNILDSLRDFQDRLRRQGVTGNFTKTDNLHITLAFIGDYGDPDAVLDAMEKVDFEPMQISLDGVGCFGKLFWVGIKDNPKLAAYVKRLRRQLSESDIPFDKKKFSPHITLIRKFNYRNGKGIPVSNLPKGNMKVGRVSLMRSERGKNGMIYTEIGSVYAKV